MEMNRDSAWQYDEFKQVGKDYGDTAEVEAYDSSHARFRDVQSEGNRILEILQIKSGETLIDFGSGTGMFAIQAARRGVHVHAVDVSPAMIAHAKTNADKAAVRNITFHHAGFLTYTHAQEPADAITTTFAFHHLPDFWKGVALSRLYDMLKPGGRFYLRDVIVEESNALMNIGTFIEKQAQAGGGFLREDAEGHFRDEYSTYDWVMDGLLQRAGFIIASKRMDEGVIGT